MSMERNLGEQPVRKIMMEHNIKAHDLVAIEKLQLTHKMIAKACKGRRLTLNIKTKIQEALNRCAGIKYSIKDLFNY